jgi:hypothetical protein
MKSFSRISTRFNIQPAMPAFYILQVGRLDKELTGVYDKIPFFDKIFPETLTGLETLLGFSGSKSTKKNADMNLFSTCNLQMNQAVICSGTIIVERERERERESKQ